MKKPILISLFTMILSYYVSAQPEIVSIAPNSGYPGQQINILIRAENAHFKSGSTSLDLGSDITVNHIAVSTNLLLTANISIDKNALSGDKKLIVQTDAEIILKDDGFEVLEEGGNLNAILSIIPLDVVHLSDFDPLNIKTSPLLFNVMISNDSKERDIKVEFILQSEKHGLVGTAIKEIKDLQPLAVVNFNNKEFDDYDISNADHDIVAMATQTGVLPSGTYHYTLNVYDEDGSLIGNDNTDYDFLNEINNIDLISPGTALDESPEVIISESLYFQWFSNARLFDFTIYEVMPGQQSADDIVTNLPVYEEKDISSPFFAYPNHAEILQEGKTYAWQIKASINSSHGEQQLFSDLFWFSYKACDSNSLQIVRIEVELDPLDIQLGSAVQFKAYGYDESGKKIKIDCNWQVIPSDGGRIDLNGNFIASDQPKTIAIVATYQGLQAYATINIQKQKKHIESEE